MTKRLSAISASQGWCGALSAVGDSWRSVADAVGNPQEFKRCGIFSLHYMVVRTEQVAGGTFQRAPVPERFWWRFVPECIRSPRRSASWSLDLQGTFTACGQTCLLSLTPSEKCIGCFADRWRFSRRGAPTWWIAASRSWRRREFQNY